MLIKHIHISCVGEQALELFKDTFDRAGLFNNGNVCIACSVTIKISAKLMCLFFV